MYQVYDRLTGAVIATYNDRKRARARMDKLDNAFGACRYNIRTVGA